MTTTGYKPMLSGKAPEDLSALRYPLLASPKLDGIRCVIRDGRALSRKLKPIPNDYIRAKLEATLPEGMDGELLLRDWTAPFKEVSSAVMSKAGEPDFTYGAFDLLPAEGPAVPFARRYSALEWVVGERTRHGADWLLRVRHFEIEDANELQHFLQDCLEHGFEGVMVRDMQGPYKFGRSTVREGYLLKVKNFDDEEAEVIGWEPLRKNENELETDELGHAKRSTAKDGLVELPLLGALHCRFDDGAEFSVGTGFTEADRIAYYEMAQGSGPWPRAKIKHQPDPGGRQPGQAPRFPVFLGFRNTEID